MTNKEPVVLETVSEDRLRDLIRIHSEKGTHGKYASSGGIHHEWSDLTVSALSELLASRLAIQAPATPDHCYDPNDWEYSMPWEDRNELVEAWDVNKPHRVATLIDGPMKWVVVLWDEENGGETRWFDSEAEAVAALPAAPNLGATK